MERELGDFMEDGYMSARASELGAFQCSWFAEVVRPNAVSLVDARDFSDFSAERAGRHHDGDVYPAIMDAAKRDPLNQMILDPVTKSTLKRLIVDGVEFTLEPPPAYSLFNSVSSK
jgi:acyl-CoA oxidase